MNFQINNPINIDFGNNPNKKKGSEKEEEGYRETNTEIMLYNSC